MQDNYPNKDKKFTDKGWAAMRDLLDEEMPVAVPEERKRRRWIFFLLFFGIGLGVAVSVVAGSLYFMENEVKEARKAVMQQPIADGSLAPNFAEKENIKTEKNTTLVEKQEVTAAAIPNKVALNQPLNPEIATNPTAKREKRSLTRLLKEGVTAEPINGIYNQASPNTLENLGISKVADGGAKEFADAVGQMKNLNLINVRKNKEEGIDYVTTNDLTQLEIMSSIPNFSLNLPPLKLPTEETKEQTSKSKASFGVEIAGQGAPNLAGVSAGLVYSLPLKNKWSLRTGLNYQYQRRTFTGTPISLDDVSFEIDPALSTNEAIQGAYNQNSARGDSAIFTIPQNLNSQYLNIPLSANYHLSPKWSVGAGFTGSLLLFASDNYTDGGLFNENADSFSNDLAIAGGTTGQDEQKSVDKANLRNFDIAGNVGIAFHPSPKWSISANYHHGFVNFFKYSSDKKYNRYGNLSVQYYFGK